MLLLHSSKYAAIEDRSELRRAIAAAILNLRKTYEAKQKVR